MTTRRVRISRSGEGDPPADAFTGQAGIPLMVLESIGPRRHVVNVPFHDSQARGRAILIWTGWDERWGTEAHGEPGPYLHEDLVFRIIRSDVRLVGVDFPDIDDSVNPARPMRAQLDRKGIEVVENLCGLKAIPRWGATFYRLQYGAFAEFKE